MTYAPDCNCIRCYTVNDRRENSKFGLLGDGFVVEDWIECVESSLNFTPGSSSLSSPAQFTVKGYSQVFNSGTPLYSVVVYCYRWWSAISGGKISFRQVYGFSLRLVELQSSDVVPVY